jgi:hypothetical protein
VSACVWVLELAYAYASGFVEYADYNQLATTVLQRTQYVVAVALNLVLVFPTGRHVTLSLYTIYYHYSNHVSKDT